MENIIKFSKKDYFDCIKNIEKAKEVIMAAVTDSDAITSREQFRPNYLNENTRKLFTVADQFLNGYVVGLFKEVDDRSSEKLFAKNDLPKLLVDFLKDIEDKKPTVLTIPFFGVVFSLSLVPYDGRWVLLDVYENTKSIFQEGIEVVCKHLNTSREDIVTLRFILPSD